MGAREKEAKLLLGCAAGPGGIPHSLQANQAVPLCGPCPRVVSVKLQDSGWQIAFAVLFSRPADNFLIEQ